ncbi:MAG: DEDD exonuclease domain-containing protein [Actinomycetota bacterium]
MPALPSMSDTVTGGREAAWTQTTLADLGTALSAVTFVVLDLETTGGSPQSSEITEVGAVKVRGGEVLGAFDTLVNPGVPIPAFTSVLTGITDRMVAGAPAMPAVLPCLLEFIGEAVAVAHNAPFDLGFLNAALLRLDYPKLVNPVVDTARLARKLLGRDEVPNVKLATLAARFATSTQPNHRALADALATVDVLHALLERAATFGVCSLEDLLAFPTARSDPSYPKIALTRSLPRMPGVYLFRDEQGRVLYVGKAKDLRTRVRSYFYGDGRAKVADLLRELETIDYEQCATELEASVKEVRLIQLHRPPYNRRSRNSGRGCYVKITDERFPRLSLVRRPGAGAADCLGPFASTQAADRVREAIWEALPIRRCSGRLPATPAGSPCALHEMGRCGAPCTGRQPAEEYALAVNKLRAALSGDPQPLLEPLERAMAHRAASMRYEEAAATRDRRDELAAALARQRKLARTATPERLVVVRHRPEGAEVVVIRRGQLVASAVLAQGADPEIIQVIAASAEEPEHFEGVVPRHLTEEVRLVASWLDGVADEARVHTVDGIFASPLSTGPALLARSRYAAEPGLRALESRPQPRMPLRRR